MLQGELTPGSTRPDVLVDYVYSEYLYYTFLTISTTLINSRVLFELSDASD
jgi:hypothetical protein